MNAIRLTILLAMTVVSLHFGSWYETHYTREATVIVVDDSSVTVVDNCGYVWNFEGTDFHVDDRVKLSMNTMNTDSDIFDDAIENAEIINK